MFATRVTIIIIIEIMIIHVIILFILLLSRDDLFIFKRDNPVDLIVSGTHSRRVFFFVGKIVFSSIFIRA